MSKSAKIRLLPSDLINLIAAGEVVQRPASVVKELIENALDAGSKHIKLLFEDGGKTLIQVIDDGCGMHEKDVTLCIQRHTTSKIGKKDDLFNIASYGFRGEAMNAIAAVAELEIMTRIDDEEVGTRLVAEESMIKKKEAIATPIGTQISVRYLFRNLPGRRNFLKSNAVESKHIIDDFQRAALARPDVAFSLYQDKAEVYRLNATKLGHRIVHLFGNQYQQELIPCNEQAGDLVLKGYVGAPSLSRKTRGGQFFFANQRYIKSAYLHHAVKKAFEGLIPENNFPFYVLFVGAPLNKIDVNVHPNKTEVKFEQEKLLYTLIATSLRKALATHHCMHTIDFEHSATKALFDSDTPPAATQPVNLSDEPMQQEEIPMLPLDHAPILHSTVLRVNNNEKDVETKQVPVKPLPDGVVHKDKVQHHNLRELEVSPTKLQLHKKYILAEVSLGLLVIDQRKACERILYERHIKLLSVQKPHSQKWLFSHKVKLQPADLTLFKACQHFLYKLGFRFNIKHDHVVITGHPTGLFRSNVPTEELIMGLLEQYKRHAEMSFTEKEKWAMALAKRNNLPPKRVLQPQEMDYIIDALFRCEQPNFTFSGERIWRVIPLEKMDNFIEETKHQPTK